MENDKEKEIVEIEKVNQTEEKENTNNTNSKKEEKKQKKGLCIASMVLGIVSLVLFCLWYISIPCGILSIIFGIVGIKTIDKGMAIAGIVTGAIGLFISFCIFMALFTFGFIMGITESIEDIDSDIHYKSHNAYYDLFD